MTDSVPAHAATPYGFWADTTGAPGSHATIGAGHTLVHFGDDGYIDMILVQPGSSSGSSTSMYNIPFNPWAYSASGTPPSTEPAPEPGTEPEPVPGSGFPTCPPGYYFNLWSGRCEPEVAGGGGDVPPVLPPASSDKVAQAIALLEQALGVLRS